MKPEKTTLRAVEGTKDIFGVEMNRFQRIMKTAAAIFGRYGYSAIATPTFEHTALFARGIGEATDIVEKEMYTFTPGSDTITLRPEGTAGVVRAYLQHNMHREQGFVKLWYAGPMFRRERPQKGRQRQFHQIGVEAIGASNAILDAETIRMALDFFDGVGVTGVVTKINTIGCMKPECRPAFREKLRAAIAPRLGELCKTCQGRFERNILRIIDCKNPECQKVRATLPRCDEHLCDECNTHHAAVQEALTAFGVPFEVNPYIVRGLDYYNKTVFEFSHPALGAQDAIGGGGRYDGLVEELGGPVTPAVGFAIGVERTLIAMEALNCCACGTVLHAYGVAVDEDCRKALAGLVIRLRHAGYNVDMDYESRSMKAQMRTADRRGAVLTLILGSDELAAGQVTVRDMREGGGQERIAIADAIDRLGIMCQARETPCGGSAS